MKRFSAQPALIAKDDFLPVIGPSLGEIAKI
jgi:hypothetical protein